MAACTDRRQFLAGASLAAAAVAIAPATAATVRTRCISPALIELMATAKRSAAISAAHDEHVWGPLSLRFSAALDRIPHTTIPIEPVRYDGTTETSTANAWMVKHARGRMKERVSFHGPGSAEARKYHESLRALADAADRRDAKVAKLRRRMRVDKESDRSDQLNEDHANALDAVAWFKPNSVADLAAAIRFLETENKDGDYAEGFIAGIKHLAGEAQA